MNQLPNNTQNQVSGNLGAFGGGISQKVLVLLMQKGFVSTQDLNQAKVLAIQKNQSIETVLLESGKITEETFYQAKAAVTGYKYINLQDQQIRLDVLGLLDKELAEKYQAIPFAEENGNVKIAMLDPSDLQKVQFLKTAIKKPIDVYVTSPGQIQFVLEKQYGAQITTEIEEALTEKEAEEGVIDIQKESRAEDISQENVEAAPVTRIINMILEYAVNFGASDVHIEPHENKIGVRFRISGILIEKLTLPKKLSSSLVARIKVLSSLKLDEHRLPQDGRIAIRVGNKEFDLRVSVMPTIYDEKVVLRLLARGGKEMSLEQAGMREPGLGIYMKALEKTEGIIIVTGPTGSGKTHTLATSLSILNKPEVNIQTLENPVEIRVDGVTQCQINPDIGLTFATGLRAFLRQDPDIIMVGEIRDKETANLAVEAALTGHLVLATLHANSASGGVPRLINMGIEPFLLSSTIDAIVGQRLTRRICSECKYTYKAEDEEIEMIKSELEKIPGFDMDSYIQQNSQGQDGVVLYKGKGCSSCNGTGYSGRVGIFEVFSVSQEISKLIMKESSAYDIEIQAIEDGMYTMKQDGFFKTLQGLTTLEEVLRVVN